MIFLLSQVRHENKPVFLKGSGAFPGSGAVQQFCAVGYGNETSPEVGSMSQQPAPKMPEPEFLAAMKEMLGGKKPEPQKESA